MPKATTPSKRIKAEPYAHASATPSPAPSEHQRSTDSDGEDDFKPDVKPKIKSPSTPKKKKSDGGPGSAGSSPSKGAKGEYNKHMLVTLILAPLKPDWEAVAAASGLTATQAYDLWRKSLLGAILANRPLDGGSFGRDVKIKVLLAVLDQAKIDWAVITVYFPDRTKNQVSDVWRKVVLPRLKRGDGFE